MPIPIHSTADRSAGNRIGMTLIEILAALMIAATLAALSIQYLRPPGDAAKQRACDFTRQLLQNDARRYEETIGRAPSADLRELEITQYSGIVLPTCPITNDSYRLGRDRSVACPTHEPTRVK